MMVERASPASIEWKVGSVVRIQRSHHPKVNSKATIATLSGSTVCLLWEPMVPRPLLPERKSAFLIAPNTFMDGDDQHEEQESTVPLEELRPLFPFEEEAAECPSDISRQELLSMIATRKEQGDTLLRCGDAASAVSYYEEALRASNIPSIGSSVIVKVEGFPKIAEIDCIDDENDDTADQTSTTTAPTMDITLVESGIEMTISQYLLGILQCDPDRLQERILLNLARCMLQLADLLERKHRPEYIKAAVLACTLAITVSTFWDENNETTTTTPTTTVPTALALRAKAYGFLSKWPHAMADAKRLLRMEDTKQQAQGKKLLESLQKRKQYQVKTDKKLAKAVAKLVHSATSEIEESSMMVSHQNDETDENHAEEESSSQKEPTASTTQISLFFTLLVIAAAILIQKVL
eukprot:scaffold11677_cov98-Cylindrotheca_fusiformis.AAC.1